MTCPAMGGPATCTVVLKGNTAQEMLADGTKHVTHAHPEIAATMAKMSPEDMAKWMAEFKPKFDALPDMPTSA